MRWLSRHGDGLRKFLLFEPRGAAVHSANVVLPSSHPKAALGYVIMESTEYPPMSGSNTISTVTAILETGILPMREPVTRLTLEAPAGLIEVTCRCEGGRVLQVKFRNVPAFVQHLDAPVEVARRRHGDAGRRVRRDALRPRRRARARIRDHPRRGAGHLRGGGADSRGGEGAAPRRAPGEPRDPRRDDHRVHGTPPQEGPGSHRAEHRRGLPWPAGPVAVRNRHVGAAGGDARPAPDQEGPALRSRVRDREPFPRRDRRHDPRRAEAGGDHDGRRPRLGDRHHASTAATPRIRSRRATRSRTPGSARSRSGVRP